MELFKKSAPHYGKSLKAHIKGKGLRAWRVGRKLKMSPAAMTAIFKNPNPRIGTIRKVCEACGSDMVEFVSRTEAEASK